MDDLELKSFRASLEEIGEQQARAILARGAWNPQRTRVAEAWLLELEEARSKRSQRESLRIARSANRAAWIAAIAAAIAVIIAALSMFISYQAWVHPRP